MSKSLAQSVRDVFFGSFSLTFGSQAVRAILMPGLSNDLAANDWRDSFGRIPSLSQSTFRSSTESQ